MSKVQLLKKQIARTLTESDIRLIAKKNNIKLGRVVIQYSEYLRPLYIFKTVDGDLFAKEALFIGNAGKYFLCNGYRKLVGEE